MTMTSGPRFWLGPRRAERLRRMRGEPVINLTPRFCRATDAATEWRKSVERRGGGTGVPMSLTRRAEVFGLTHYGDVLCGGTARQRRQWARMVARNGR